MNKKEFDYRGIGHIHFQMPILENEKVPSLLRCLIHVLIRVCYYVLFRRCTDYPFSKEILFVSQSLNNKRTLLPITHYLRNNNWSLVEVDDFPCTLLYQYSLPYWCSFLSFYRGCDMYEREKIRNNFQFFFLAPGYYSVFSRFIDSNKQLRMIVVANDHTFPIRCLIEAAKEKNLAVVYTQHASITEKFPPLHFSFSFLDGQESYEKYCAIGDLQGKVILLGSPRYDTVTVNRLSIKGLKRDAVGVGLNEFDSIEKVIKICVFLREKTRRRVIVRPHPRTMLSFNCALFLNHGIEISDSVKETSFDFFTHISVLIANESGIHLDAAIFGIPSVLYNFSDNPVKDWYGYIRKGLTVVAKTNEQLVSLINSAKPVSDKIIQYYYAAYNTDYDGRIAETIAGFLEEATTGEMAIKYLQDHFIENNNVYSIA